jgi:predicted transcriptional regulator YdeE
MQSVFVPAQRYAVFTCTLTTLMQVLHEANHIWLPASAFQRDDGPEVEGYAPGFDGHHPASTFTFSIPVRPRDQA